MGTVQNAVISYAAKETSQFEITSDLLRNLYKFNLTPVTKLVLLELTTHLNESKNGSVVFPSVGYIAEVLGIGLTAAKKAINDLIKEGLIIKSKRDKVRGNYNKYLLRLARMSFKAGKNENGYKSTQVNINNRKIANKSTENEHLKQSHSDRFMITSNYEKINNKEEEILKKYAQRRGAKNSQAYIATLIRNGSYKQIIEEYKQIENRKKHAENNTKNFVNESKKAAEEAVPPTESWKALKYTIFKDMKYLCHPRV